jgi:TolB-like protein
VAILSALILSAPTTASAAKVKNVAVVETVVDEQSDAYKELTRAEVRQITAELRRVTVNNLPRDRFNVMTQETVQSQSGAVLERCAGENCVIKLGETIGAEYIVKGTISKFRTRFTLSVEMYETNNGNLVAALSDPVRSENVDELLEKTAAACAKMYKKFISPEVSSAPATIPTSAPVPIPEPISTSTDAGNYNANVRVNPPDGGYVTRNPDKSSYNHGEQFVATAIPYDGYRFVYWAGIAAGGSNPVTITMNWHKNVVARFERLDATEDINSPAHSKRSPK